MATLRIPDKNVTLRDPSAVRQFLDRRGIVHERWSADRDLPSDATNEQVLAAYDYLLKPFMDKGGYQTADVVVSMDTHRILQGFVKSSSGNILTAKMKCVSLSKVKATFGSTRKDTTRKSSPCCASKAISFLSRPTQSTGST